MAAAAFSESTPSAIGIRTGVEMSSRSALSPARSDPISTATRSTRDDLVDRRGGHVGRHRQQLPTVERPQLVAEPFRSGMGERERGPHRDAQRSSGERVGTGVVEDEAIEAECRGVADDRADVGRVVDRFEHDEAGGVRGELGDARPRRSLEQGDDRVWVAESGHEAAHLDAPAVHRAGQRGGERRDVVGVHERRNGDASRIECPFDHQVALGEEQAGAGVVAFLRPAGEPTLVQPELPEPLIVGVLDRNDLRGRSSAWQDVITGRHQ